MIKKEKETCDGKLTLKVKENKEFKQALAELEVKLRLMSIKK